MTIKSNAMSLVARHKFLYSAERLKLAIPLPLSVSRTTIGFTCRYSFATRLNLINQPREKLLFCPQRCEEIVVRSQPLDDDQRPMRQSYSLDDMKPRIPENESSNRNSRPFPPMLDSHFDEGFGALPYNEYDDVNDLNEMQTSEKQSKDKEIVSISNSSDDDPDDADISIEYTPEELKQIRARENTSVYGNPRFSLEGNGDNEPIENEEDSDLVDNTVKGKSSLFVDKVYIPETLESLQEKFDMIAKEIYALNNGVEFNINASKQVSLALFGTADESTNKDALQVWISTGRYPMANLIVECRSIRSRIKYLQKKENSIKQGTAVQSAFAIQTLGSTTKDITSRVADVEDPIILIDASSYIFRAYYTMPPIHRGDGMPIGAVMGFCKMLNSLFLSKMLENQVSGKLPPRVVMCFDAKGKTFRHDMYTDYKANRPPAPIDLIPQFDLVRQAADAYGIKRIEAPYYEADDVIATMATMAFNEGLDTNILSGDKDLMQLVTSPPSDDITTIQPSIQLIDPATKDRTTYQQVVDKWAVPPNRLGDVLALAGDSADNIPGVAGIGPKIAASLINEFGSLDNLLDNLDKVPQQKRRETLQSSIDIAKLSRKLVELDCAVPQEAFTGFPPDVFAVSELRMEPIDISRLVSFYDEMGFKELKRTLLLKSKGLKTTRSKTTGSWTKNQSRTKTTIPKPEDYADVPF